MVKISAKENIVDLPELKEWARKEFASGTSKDDLAQILLEHTGWHKESVDIFISKLNLKEKKIKIPPLPKLKEIKPFKEIKIKELKQKEISSERSSSKKPVSPRSEKKYPQTVLQKKLELKDKLDHLENEINNHKKKFSDFPPPQKKNSFWKNLFEKKKMVDKMPPIPSEKESSENKPVPKQKSSKHSRSKIKPRSKSKSNRKIKPSSKRSGRKHKMVLPPPPQKRIVKK